MGQRWWKQKEDTHAAESIDGTAIEDGTILDADLSVLGTTRKMGARDVGRAMVGYFYCTGNVADTELVTINARTYEFDTNSTSTT